MTALSLTIKSDELIFLSGDLTFATINKKTVQMCDFKKINHEFVLDLTQITHSDSAGLALLIEWLKISKTSQGQIRFQNIPQQLLTLANLSGFAIEPYLANAD